MKKLLKLAALAGIAVGISKIVATKKEWSGLTEAEARAKLDAKLAPKVDDASKRAEIGDKVIEGMRKKGLLRATGTAEGNGGVPAPTGGESTGG